MSLTEKKYIILNNVIVPPLILYKAALAVLHSTVFACFALKLLQILVHLKPFKWRDGGD